MTLEEFSTDTRAPILHKDTEFTTKVPGKGRISMYRGPIPARRAYGALQYRERDKHYHKNEEGYALSARVLRKLRTLGCQRILIAEEDTRCVYEFHEQQFTNQVAKHNNPNHENDPQFVVKLENAWYKHEEHTDSVMVGEREHN